MEFGYCERWFRAKKQPVKPLTFDEAHVAFESRELLTVVFHTTDIPTAFLEFNGDYIGVGFLDGELREYLSYQFVEVEPGKVFLRMASYREFEGQKDIVVQGTTYHFSTDGDVTIEFEDYLNKLETRGQKTCSVIANWDDYPVFGHFHSHLRIDRGMNPD